MSFDPSAASSDGSVRVAVPTTSAHPSIRIGSPTGDAGLIESVWRYAGFSSSARWCSAVG